MNLPTSKCADIEPLLDAYLDGELSALEKADVDAHLSVCERCAAELASIARVVASLKTLPHLEPARDLTEDLDALIAASKRRQLVVHPAAWVAIAAAAALAVVAYRLIPGVGTVGAVAHKPDQGGATYHVRQSGEPQSRPEGAVGPVTKDADPAPAVVPAPSPSAVQTASVPPARTSLPERGGEPPGSEPVRETPGQTPAVSNGDELFDGGSVAVAVLDQGGQLCVTEDLGLETDEDGLYALKI